MSTEQLDEQPLWVHRAGDLYLPIAVAAWMNETGHGFQYHLLANACDHEQAIRTGLQQQDSDDFVIGVIRGGRLVAMLWMHEVVDYDPAALAEVAGQLGLRGGVVIEAEVRLAEALRLVREHPDDEYSLLRAANHSRMAAELLVEQRLTEHRGAVVKAEQLVEAYDDGWTMAVFATMPEDLSGEDKILRLVELQPTDNPYRGGDATVVRRTRLVADRGVVAHELAIAVDMDTDDLATWVGVVDALIASGALRDLPADSAASVIAAVEELLDNPTVRAADAGGAESFVAVSALREALSGARGGCDDADCNDCDTEWDRL